MAYVLYPGSAIAGAQDGSAAAAGNIGEIIESVQTSALGSGFTIAQFGNITTIALTPGSWVLTGIVQGSFLATTTQNTCAISAFSGNTTTDHTSANVCDCPLGVTGALNGAVTIANWQVNISVAATYYLKSKLTVAVGNVLTGRLTAIRIR